MWLFFFFEIGEVSYQTQIKLVLAFQVCFPPHQARDLFATVLIIQYWNDL